MKSIVLGIFLFVLASPVFAGGDPIEVRLKIVDSFSGEALIGAHVVIKDSDIELYSDPEGYVILDPSLLQETADITVEYISYVDASIQLDLKPGMTVLTLIPR
jgi:hypothetical protein